MTTRKDIWNFKLTNAALFVIAAGIGVNYIGNFLTSVFHIPLWMDSIGTILSAFLLGPVGGLTVGFFSNYAYGFIDHISYLYTTTSMVIGITAGIFSRTTYFQHWYRTILLIFMLVILCDAVSTPLNVIAMAGNSGITLWDDIFSYLQYHGIGLFMASFLAEAAGEFADKTLMVVISILCYRNLPKSILKHFQ